MLALAGLALVLATACAPSSNPAAPPIAIPSTTAARVSAAPPAAVPTVAVGPTDPIPSGSTVPVPLPGSCHAVGGLPDRACTPGRINPTLSRAELCAAGFSTKTIRPPVSYTDPLKRRLMASYGLTKGPEFYELDHVLSLEDLGHPWAVENLWPQERGKTLPGSVATGAEPNAEEKDQVETRVHKMICASSTDDAGVAALQAQLVADWTKLRPPAGAVAVSPDELKDQEP